MIFYFFFLSLFLSRFQLVVKSNFNVLQICVRGDEVTTRTRETNEQLCGIIEGKKNVKMKANNENIFESIYIFAISSSQRIEREDGSKNTAGNKSLERPFLKQLHANFK